jgi:predicted O-methyltransferase YrrM
VVELGAGMSILFLAKVLHERPGSQLISVDHDANWLDYLGEQLKRIGAASVVRLVHAPLEPVELQDGMLWYSRAALSEALSGHIVDAAIVDGPTARHGNDAEIRSHALTMLMPQLNPSGSVVFLDDIDREGERRIYERWAREFDLEQVTDAEFCGLGILVPRAHPLKFKLV